MVHNSLVIVEAHPLTRTALSMAITAAGMNVLAEISSNKDVMPLVPGLHPDLVLFSVGTPGLDDLKTISSLHKALPETFIAALLSGEINGQEKAALGHGAKMVIQKTATREEILSMLEQLRNLL